MMSVYSSHTTTSYVTIILYLLSISTMLNVHLQLLSFSCMPNNSAAASGRDAAAIVESVEAGEIIEHIC